MMTRVRLPLRLLASLVCLLCIAASPASVAADTSITLALPTNGVFYAGGSSPVTWTSDFQATIGGAALSLDCGENVVVTNSPQCLSQSNGTFLVVGTAVDSTGVACTATVSGAQAASYSTVSGESYVATIALVPVVAQTAVSVSPATSATSPYTSYQTDIVTVSLTPAAATPAGPNLTVAVSCTSASGVWTTSLVLVAGVSDPVQYSYTLSALGGATCSHAYSSSQQQPFTPISDVILLSRAQTPFVVSGQPSGIYGYTATLSMSVANPLTDDDADLTIQLTCTSTGVTGTTATDSENNAATIVMKAGGVNASFLINTPAVSVGYMAKVACTFTAVVSGPSPFVFAPSSASFQFQVGTRATFSISPSRLQLYPIASATTLNAFVLSGTVIDTDVTLTPVCYQNGLAISQSPASMTFLTGVTQLSTSFIGQTSLSPGLVQCKWTISGTDAVHFAPRADFNVTVFPLVSLTVLGVPPTIVTGSTDAATSFNVTMLNPQFLNGYGISVSLSCSGATVDPPVLIGAASGSYVSGTTGYFQPGSNTANIGFNVTVPALASVDASVPVTCTWQLGNDVAILASGTAPPFSFLVGTQQPLTTTPALAVGQAAIPVVVGSSTTITINAAAGIINTSLIISPVCSTCGNTGLGTTGLYSSSADVSNTLTGTFPSSVSGNVFTFLAAGAGIVECSFPLSGTDKLHFTQPQNIVFNVTAPPVTITPAAPGNAFSIAVSGGVTSPTAGTGSVVSTPTVIPPTGDDQTYTVTVASPGANIYLGLGCTNNGAAMTITAAGGGSVTGGRTVVIFSTASTADGTYSFTVAAAEAAAGVNVVCTFATVSGADAASWSTPNAFRFYTGPTVALVVDFTPAPTLPSYTQPRVTLTTTATTSTQGFTLQTMCSLVGSEAATLIAMANGAGSITSTSGVVRFAFTFSPGSTTSQWFFLQSNTPGQIVCTYGAIDGADYLRFTAPPPTTMITGAVVSFVHSGETSLVDSSSGSNVAVIPSTQSTATIAIAPSAIIPAGVSATLTLSCRPQATSPWSSALDVSPSVLTFNSATGTTPMTATVSLPTTGTETTPVGLMIVCTQTLAASSSRWFTAPGSFYFAVGTAGTFDITSTEGFLSYKSISGQTTLSSSVFTLVPSYCPGAGGSFSISGSCVNGGGIVFTASGSASLTTTAAIFGAQNTFRFQSPSATGVDTDTCTFSLSSQSNLYFASPTFNITLVDRRTITFTGVDSSLTAGGSVTASIYPTLPAISGGVAIIVTCTGSGDARQLLTPSTTSFYFHEGDNTPQTFTVTAGSSFIFGSCAAAARVDADGNGYAYSSVTATAGTLQTIAAPSIVEFDTCSKATLNITLSTPPTASFYFVVTCLWYAGGSVASINVASGVTVATYTYTALGFGLKDVCTFEPHLSASDAAIFDTTSLQTTFIAGSGPQGQVSITTAPAPFIPSASAISVVVQPSIRVPYASLIMSATSNVTGVVTSTSEQRIYSSLNPVTFTLQLPLVSAGSPVGYTFQVTLFGDGAAYFQQPSPATFVLAPTNSMSGALSQSTDLSSGQIVDFTVQLDSAVTAAFTADVQCRNVNTSTIVLARSVPLAVGDTTSAPLPMLLSADTSAVYLVQCSIIASGTGATLITSSQSLSFSFVGVSSVISSSTGSGGGSSSTGGGVISDSSSGGVVVSGGSSGEAGGAGAFSSSTAGNSDDCFACAAIGAASVPSLILYAALIAVAIAANSN